MPDIAETEFVVHFAAHMPRDRIANIASGIAAYGNVYPSADGMSLVVKVFRASKLPRLEKRLQAWERDGFLIANSTANSSLKSRRSASAA